MNGKYTNLFRIFFAFADLLAFNILHLILLYMMKSLTIDNENNYTTLVIFNNMSWLISSYITGIYINHKMFDLKKILNRTSYAVLIFLFSQFTFIHFYLFHFNRLFLLLNFAGFITYLLISRITYIAIIFFINSDERFKRKVAIIGCNELSNALVKQLESHRTTFAIKGFFDDGDCDRSVLAYPVLSEIKDCIAYAIDNDISEIYSTISPEQNPWIYQLAEIADKNCIRFKFVPDLRAYVNRDIQLDFIDNIPILSLRPEPLDSISQQIKKRFFDIVFASLVITLLLSWLLPVLALLIKLDSDGPIFFKQIRSGKNNRPFLCLKLRSLCVNQQANQLQVTRNDTRVTKLGRFLRKTNLDELPQFFNVLVGHMSVVGSRPHMLKHTEDYANMYNRYMVRHFAKPGVTGWAQINGYRGEIKETNQLVSRVEHDIWYMENWNVWLDVRIILLTLSSTIKGDKNAF